MAVRRKKLTTKEAVERAEKAFKELEGNMVTQANTKRLWSLWGGLRALDDENVEVKELLEDVLQHFKNVPVGNRTKKFLQDLQMKMNAYAAQGRTEKPG